MKRDDQCEQRKKVNAGRERCLRSTGHEGGHVYASSGSVTAYMAGLDDGRASRPARAARGQGGGKT